jgi:stearoyl-CoA desaturase (delta-9 desaturase)
VDLSYYSLKVLSWVRVVSDLRTPSDAVKYSFKKYTAEDQAALNAPIAFWGAAAAHRRGAGDKVREALAAAAEHLPTSAPSPQPMLKRQ